MKKQHTTDQARVGATRAVRDAELTQVAGGADDPPPPPPYQGRRSSGGYVPT